VKTVPQLIELQQYLKASWFNDIGLQANYNMKRESIGAEEGQMNNDGLIPLIEDMLKSRKEGIEQVNTMFSTNISVELASSWKIRKEEISGQPENEELEEEELEEEELEEEELEEPEEEELEEPEEKKEKKEGDE